MRTFPAQHMQVPSMHSITHPVNFFSFEVAVTIKSDASICYRISAHIYTHLNPGPTILDRQKRRHLKGYLLV